MNKRLTLLAAILVVGILGSSCGAKQAALPPLTVQEISAQTLWKRVMQEEPYRRYANWPNHKGIQQGKSPHGLYHEVFINDILKEALPLSEPKVPNGGIIVKENYNSAKKLVAYTVMAKVQGYNPLANDWFWAKYEPDGTVSASEKPQKCIDCHSSRKKNDYVMLGKLQ